MRETPVTRPVLCSELRSHTQLVDLLVLRGFGHGGGHKTHLAAVHLALTTGAALTMLSAPNLVAAAFCAEVLRVNHKSLYTDFILK